MPTIKLAALLAVTVALAGCAVEMADETELETLDESIVSSTPARVQYAVGRAGANATSVTASWPAATGAGRLLLAAVTVHENATSGSIAVTPPSGWTVLGSVERVDSAGPNLKNVVYGITNAASRSGAQTFALGAPAPGGAVVTLLEYSGMATASVVDRSATATGSSGVASSGTTAASTQASELWLAVLGNRQGDNAQSSQTGAFTRIHSTSSTSARPGVVEGVYEKIVSATGTASTSVTLAYSSSWAGIVLALKAGSAAPSCTGVAVAAGANLSQVVSSYSTPQTFCLAAGTFRVTTPVMTQNGDVFVGAGRDATLIDGSGLSRTAVGIFNISGSVSFSHLDVFGAPTPVAGSGIYCSPSRASCGKAFAVGGAGTLTLRSLDCHDNGGNCVGGGGNTNVIADDIDCARNGNAYSMTTAFRYAACMKRAAVYSEGGDTIVTNSRIHDNAWVGLWCDFCKFGYFRVENSSLTGNGKIGIAYEMSGGWTSSDHALIRNNLIQNSGGAPGSEAGVYGGVGVSTANDIVIESNTFGGNQDRLGVKIIYTPSRLPPQPDNRGTIVRNNIMGTDIVSGCTLAGVSCSNNL